MRARVKELESQVLTVEEKSRLQGKIRALENQVGDLEGRLAETQRIAGEFEEKFEHIRQLWGDWADLIVETADHLDLIPKDVKALQEERDSANNGSIINLCTGPLHQNTPKTQSRY